MKVVQKVIKMPERQRFVLFALVNYPISSAYTNLFALYHILGCGREIKFTCIEKQA